MNTPLLEHLKSLHDGAVDARDAYDLALREAGGHGLSELFQRMTALHQSNALELATVLARYGAAPEPGGSFLTTIQRTLINIGAIFDRQSESILPGLIQGETSNVASYQEALDLPGIDPTIRDLLAAQRDRLRIEIAAMHALGG